jgi:ferredoxin-NADP reductase
VYFEGPYGLFTTVVRTGKDAVLIGAGIGITPIRSVVESMLASARKVTVILRANEASQLYLRQEFTALKASGGIDVLELIGPPPARDAPPTWLPSEPGRSGSLATLVPQLRDADVYVCGPAPWARLVIRDARAAGVPRSQIHTERFTW